MICNLFPQPLFFLFSSDVPQLLYYAHIPANIVALLISFYAFWNNKESLLNKLLLTVSVLFSFWTISNLILWTNINSDFMIFIWSFLGLILGAISIACIYLMYVFLENKDVSTKIKFIFFALLTPIIFLASTSYNLSGFNITTCDAFQFEWSPYKLYSSFMGVLAMVWILILIIRKYRSEKTNFRKQIILMGAGVELFLFSFFTMEFLATYLTKIGILPDSGLEIYGLFGMVIFMFFITLLIVRFQTFHVRLFGAQTLVLGLVTLVGSKIFTAEVGASRIITILSLVFVSVFGYFLIKSVKKEIETRERIQRLADQLEVAGEAQADTIRFISHQIRGVFTATKGSLASILDGDYDPIPENLKTMIQNLFVIQVNGVDSVQAFLSASQLENGNPFTMAETDFKEIATQVCTQLKQKAEKKGLVFEVDIPIDEVYKIMGDKTYLLNAILNVVDNSINYTPTGAVKVSLSKVDDSLLFSVRDTGVGINEEDGKKMFTKYGHGKDSRLVNVNSNGLGLFFTKKVVDGHHGTVWYESEAGKGTTFFIKLPLVK